MECSIMAEMIRIASKSKYTRRMRMYERGLSRVQTRQTAWQVAKQELSQAD